MNAPGPVDEPVGSGRLTAGGVGTTAIVEGGDTQFEARGYPPGFVAAGALWVPVRTPAVDRAGLPTMTALRRLTADGSVRTVATARGRVDVHGLAAGLGSVWIADNTSGLLYRLAT